MLLGMALDSIATVSVQEEQAWNDQALDAPLTAPQLRFWRYVRAGVVLGASQAALLPPASAAGVDTVVRGSGGNAVLAGPWMLSLSAALPAQHPIARAGILPAYEWLGRHCEAAMRDLGIAGARATPDKRDAGELKWACFAGLSPWETTVDGRKLVGLAQRRRRHGVLVAAGVLLEPPDWPLLCRVMGRPPQHAAMLASSTVSCRELLPSAPNLADVAAAIRRHLDADARVVFAPAAVSFSPADTSPAAGA
jgi:lipoate-protein ligase A